jgi:hypothetical protein
MAADFHKNPLPAWIVLPFMFACIVAVLATWGTGSLFLGLLAAIVGAISAAWWCEHMLRTVAGTIAQIAGGDRYAALSERTGGGALARSAAAAETMRQALIDADALVVISAVAKQKAGCATPAAASSPSASATRSTTSP